MKTKELIDTIVLNKDGNEIGKLADFDVDLETGTIKKIVISAKSGFFSSDEAEVLFEDIDKFGDYIILKIDVLQEEFES